MREWMLGIVVLGACVEDEPQTTTLAELGRVTLDVWVASSIVDTRIRYDAAEAPQGSQGCAILGSDFAASLSGVPGSTFPGGFQGYCRYGHTNQPCESYEACDSPFAGFHDWPLIDNGVLEIGDTSRTIRCDLKDALVPRRLVRVDKQTWDVEPLERVTVRWEPSHEVVRLEPRVWLTEEPGHDPWYVEWQFDGELISFVVPPVEPGIHTLWIAGGYELDNANGCGGVPNRQLRTYHADQLLNVK